MDYDQLLDGCGEVGAQMLGGGAEIYRVEDTVRRMLAAYGVRGDVFAIPNCLIVSLTDETGASHTRMRRIQATKVSTDIEVVERFNALSRSICAQPPPPARLPALAAETGRQCRRYHMPMVLLGYFLGALFFTGLFQGGVLEALTGGGGGRPVRDGLVKAGSQLLF